MVTNPVTEYHDTPNKWASGNRKEEIIIHWWGDPNADITFDWVLQHFKNPESQVSAHFVVEEGRVAQLANLDDRCWHARQANSFTIGIECHPRKTNGDIVTVAHLIAWIWQRLGRKIELSRHNYYVPTLCPGVWAELVDNGELETLATRIYEGKEINMITSAQIWGHRFNNYLGNEVTAQGLLYWLDKNQGGQYKLLVEANERTKAIADAIAAGGEINREQIEKTVKKAVNAAMDRYELTLSKKQEESNNE